MANTYKNKFLDASNTGVLDIYTATGVTAIVQSIHVANISDASNDNITIQIYDNGASTAYKLISEVIIPVNTAFNVVDRPLVLEASDKIQVQAEEANVFHVTVSVLEIS
tara:strand:- start:3430 stop:3756 length:327 start_codon:yes stop_codon:yes gene_type:complete